MKKYILISLLITSVIFGFSQNEVVDANNKFAFDLLKQIEGKENMCFSPYSIFSALKMTQVGAVNKTADQMNQVLYSDVQDSQLKEFSSNNNTLKELNNDNVKLRIANSIWIQKSFNIETNYVEKLDANFETSLNKENFVLKPDLARKNINQWVNDQTQGKITDLLQPGSIHELTRFVLVNAIYLKAPWYKPFKKENTYKDKFHLSKRKSVETDYMKERMRIQYASGLTYDAIRIPYHNGQLKMTIVVPKQIKKQKKFSKKFNYDFYQGLKDKFKSEMVEVNLPKFEFRQNINLKKELSKLGMSNAFSNSADFSGITGNQSLKIDEVVHEAYINVNEEGTEAAAATAVIMRVKNAMKPQKPIVFKADKPFYFMIEDSKNETILFFGKVNQF